MKEEIMKLAEDLLTPIGWYGEKAKTIEGIEKFAEKIILLFEEKKETTEN